MSQRTRLLIAAGFVIAAVAAFVVAKPSADDEDPPPPTETRQATTTIATFEEEQPKPKPPLVDTRDGGPAEGIKKLTFVRGQRVTFRVRSNVDEEIHVHGYDIYRDIPAGKTTRVSFTGELDGIFEIELHGSGQAIAELRVNP